jgi:hypothetical protein
VTAGRLSRLTDGETPACHGQRIGDDDTDRCDKRHRRTNVVIKQ